MIDESPHGSTTASVDGVRIHYLDWKGTGPALLLVPGLGNTAHVFDEFAPGLTDTFRVVGVTRVGYGESEQPEDAAAYSLDARVSHLAAVLDAAGIAQATLVGHSLAGDELTAFAAAHPERTTSLVYLDAAYDHTLGERWQQALIDFLVSRPPLTAADRASADAMRDYLWAVQGVRIPDGEVLATMRFDAGGVCIGSRTPDRVRAAMKRGRAAPNYSRVRAPALALYADAMTAAERLPWLRGDAAANARATQVLRERVLPEEATERARFAHEVASGRVESFQAHHYNFLSHPGEVERRIRAFLGVPTAHPARLARDVATSPPEPPMRVAVSPPPTAVPLPAALRTAAAGTFGLQFPGGRVVPLVLRADEERVTVQVPGQASLPLVYLGDDTFGAAFDPSFRLRLLTQAERVTGVVLQQGGHTLEGERQEASTA